MRGKSLRHTRLVAVMIVFSIGWTSLVCAQINESDTTRFQLRASLSGNVQEGNVEFLAIRGKIDFSWSIGNDWVFKSQNNSLYQEFFSRRADHDLFSRNFAYFRPQNRVYPFAIAYVSTNFRRRVDFRYFAGAGASWQLVDRPGHVLKLSASAVYEQSRFKGATYNFQEYDGQDEIALWRGTLYLGGWAYWFDKHLRLYYDAYWQPGFDNPNNYRTQLDIGFDFPIWKGWSFNALYTQTHENVVITNIRQDDRILTFGFGYGLRVNR